MRIDDLNRTPVTQGAEKTDQAAEKRVLEKDRGAAGADQADVSELARALAPRDPARMEQLRLEVQSGKYDASSEAIAKSIIDAHLQE